MRERTGDAGVEPRVSSHELEYARTSNDGAGKATANKCVRAFFENPSASVYGASYRCPRDSFCGNVRYRAFRPGHWTEIEKKP